MKAFRVAPFVLLLWCTCAAADDTPPAAGPDDNGVRLKWQPALIPFVPSERDQLPLFFEADQLQGHQEQETEAQGEVRVWRRGQSFYADWLRYDKPEDEINARGNVRIEQDDDVLRGSKLRFNLETEHGELDDPAYEVVVKATRGHGTGDKLLLEGDGRYRLVSGDYTTCRADDPAWVIRADDFELDKQRQVGTGRNASIIFMGMPIFYTPYLSFSLDKQRKSGFLMPTAGSSGNSGVEFSLPYYWNIAPNYDATLTPRYMAKRGLQMNTEFRYIEPTYSGEFHYEVLPDDRVDQGQNRYGIFLTHNQSWGNGWNGALNIQKVSDDTYFTDLSTQITATSTTLLPRQGTLSHSGAWGSNGIWGFSALMQRWQTLQPDPLQPVAIPYDRAPQITFSASRQDFDLLDFNLDSNFTDFTHPTLVNGRRSVAYPSISLPLQSSFAYLIPKIGVNYTHYDLDASTTTLAASQSRTVPIFSTESGLIFEREASFYGQTMTQSLEPKLYYVYIPARNQNTLPNFDSGIQDLNFATLFTENQFSGYDRINDANQITAGITSRFLQQDGVERLRVGLAQRYYFSTQEVTLPGVPARASNSSDLLALVSGTIAPHWTTDFGWQYTTNLSQTQRLSVDTRYAPEPGKVLNVGYRYVSAAESSFLGLTNINGLPGVEKQVDFSAQWPITARWSILGRWNYSLENRSLLEGLAGFEYNDGCCWALRVVAHSFTTSTTSQVNAIFIQLELNGVSQFGSNPLELLRRSIGGYSRQTAADTFEQH
ncbi:MAG TPA: LPS-assembly protein LptD [Burkholderiales bacterium]|nr:LPS-assembly protein LptD [Burkholderiales bacterium]